MIGMRYQPQGSAKVNKAHPLSRALTFAWVASAPDFNLVTGKSATVQGSALAKLPYINRMGRKFAGVGSLDFGNTPETNFSGAGEQTVFAEIFIPDTTTGGGYILGRVSSAWDYHLQFNAGSQQLAYATGGDASGLFYPATSVPGGLAPLQGRPVPICGTYDKTTQRLYLDGLLANSSSRTTSFSTSTDPFGIGARGGGGQTPVSGIYVGVVLIFKRAFTEAEAKAISENPWQLFEAANDEVDLPAGSGATPPASIDGTLAIMGAASVLALAGSVNYGATLSLAGADGVMSLTGSSINSGSMSLAANDAVLSLAGSQRLAGTLSLAPSLATLLLSGAQAIPGALTFGAGDSALSLAGALQQTIAGALTLVANDAVLSLNSPNLNPLGATLGIARRRTR